MSEDVPRLIVLSGEAGAGKDSVAKILVEQHGWVVHSLAAPLKRFGEDMFGFTKEQLYGPSKFRNEPDPRWARPCPDCDATAPGNCYTKFCSTCAGTGNVNDNSVRRVLQLLGEEYLRQMIHVDALTIRARPDIEALMASGKSVVVNDARNENDRENLHAWLGAHRVDVKTPNKKKDNASWRSHSSELSRPDDEHVDYVITNVEEWPFPSLPGLVEAMLSTLVRR